MAGGTLTYSSVDGSGRGWYVDVPVSNLDNNQKLFFNPCLSALCSFFLSLEVYDRNEGIREEGDSSVLYIDVLNLCLAIRRRLSPRSVKSEHICPSFKCYGDDRSF